METNEIIKKVLEQNKIVFENTYNAVVAVQQQAEELTGKTLEKVGIIPEEGKVFVQRWFELGKKSVENYKQVVTKGQQQVEEYIAAL